MVPFQLENGAAVKTLFFFPLIFNRKNVFSPEDILGRSWKPSEDPKRPIFVTFKFVFNWCRNSSPVQKFLEEIFVDDAIDDVNGFPIRIPLQDPNAAPKFFFKIRVPQCGK